MLSQRVECWLSFTSSASASTSSASASLQPFCLWLLTTSNQIWIAERRNLIITGACGLGKSWLACALGQKACREDLSVLYYRVPRLLGRPSRSAAATGRYSKLLRSLARIDCCEAAEETGFIEKVPVLDAAGKPTGQYEYRFGEEGEKGYLKWLATNQPAQFASLYGRLVPREVNQKSEQKTVVRYETIEERRQAMIAKGWSPTVLAALEEAMEEAMEPKFLREQKKKEEVRAALRERGIDPDILEAPSDVLAAIGLKFLEYKKPDPVQ